MTTITDKRAIGAGWTGTPPPDTYQRFLERADPERAAREERDRVAADLMQRASFGYDQWQAAEEAGNEGRAEKFRDAYFYRIEQLDYLSAAPLLTWCEKCSPRPQEGQQSRLDGEAEETHMTCLDHMETVLRERAARRARGE